MITKFQIAVYCLILTMLYASGSDSIVRIPNPVDDKFTSLVPSTITKIKIEAVTLDEHDGSINGVVGTKELNGPATTSFLSKWRHVAYTQEANLCDPQPGYRISFYRSDGQLFSVAEICFECGVILFRKAASDKAYFGQMNFHAHSKTSSTLRSYLAHLFPGHDPDAAKL